MLIVPEDVMVTLLPGDDAPLHNVPVVLEDAIVASCAIKGCTTETAIMSNEEPFSNALLTFVRAIIYPDQKKFEMQSHKGG